MSGIQGPTPDTHKVIERKGKAQQMVSRDDLIKAIQQMQLPGHQNMNQSQSAPQVIGGNG